jgi:hypothetical protein
VSVVEAFKQPELMERVARTRGGVLWWGRTSGLLRGWMWCRVDGGDESGLSILLPEKRVRIGLSSIVEGSGEIRVATRRAAHVLPCDILSLSKRNQREALA